MNKLTSIRVPINGLCFIVIFLVMNCGTAFSQEETYTTIRKNVNPLAFDLDHNLSNTQDSLLLENKSLFKKVRFLNKTTEKVFDFKPAVKHAKIPLGELPLGTYTVMFYQADKIIVFQINRVLPFDYEFLNETNVTLAEIADVDLETGTTMAEVRETNLEYDTANLNVAINNAGKDYEALEALVKRAYNISDANRDNMMSRAEYRQTHLRPNGKPYND